MQKQKQNKNKKKTKQNKKKNKNKNKTKQKTLHNAIWPGKRDKDGTENAKFHFSGKTFWQGKKTKSKYEPEETSLFHIF